MMRTLLFCWIITGILLCFNFALAGDQELNLSNLFERSENCFVIGWRDNPLVPPGLPVESKIKLPKLHGIPGGRMDDIENNPHYALVNKFPELKKRQRQIEVNPPQQFISSPTPLEQMFDRWLGARSPFFQYYEIDMNGNKIESRLGVLFVPIYGWSPMGIYDLSYKQPKADLVKPFLFYVDGQYYSVYGDTQLAQHVPIEGYPENLAALRYAGNPLYAYSEEMPPALQSYGVGPNGVIWLADIEGHIAFFKTKDKEFVQEISKIEGATRVCIPRENLSSSIFTFDKVEKKFQEYHINITKKPLVEIGIRVLPAEVLQVLYCDAEKVVFLTLTADGAFVRTEEKKQAQPKHIELAKDERIVEGLYLFKKDEVYLLIGKKPKEENNPFEVRKSWEKMRLLRLSL